MALFDKKSPAEKVIAMFEALSDDDKENVKNHFMEKAEDLEKAEDEREVDKIEEEKAETETEKDEKSEEVAEESEEIGKDVNEAEAEEPEEVEEQTETEEDLGGEPEAVEERPEIAEGLEARLKALEEKFDKMLAMTEEPDRDIGISGYGNSTIDNIDRDTRGDDVIKKLGGYAR